jgi:hypothetical protein
MANRVDEIPKFHRALAVTLQCRRQNNPGRGMSVLTAVLTDPRHVSFDISRLKSAIIERRIKQLYQAIIDVHEPFLDRVHR